MKISPIIVKTKAMTPKIIETVIAPAMNQTTAATTPPVAIEPNSRPNRPFGGYATAVRKRRHACLREEMAT